MWASNIIQSFLHIVVLTAAIVVDKTAGRQAGMGRVKNSLSTRLQETYVTKSTTAVRNNVRHQYDDTHKHGALDNAMATIRPATEDICNTSLSLHCLCHQMRESFLVDCSHKNLTSVPSNIPKEATEVNLSENWIKDISPGSFETLVLLEILDLSENRLSRLVSGTFLGLTRLKHLHLNGNSLNMSTSTFDSDVFVPLSNLTYMNLKSPSYSNDQSFMYPDTALSTLKSLETLLINGINNRIFGEGFRRLTSIQTLDLSNSPLFTSVSAYTFHYFQNISVKNLILSHCNLSWIDKEALSNLRNLDTIDFSFNEYLEIKGVGMSMYGLQHSNVRRLIMQRVHAKPSLTAISADDLKYIANTELEELDLNNNSIGQLGEGVLTALPLSLRVIRVSHNNIHTYNRQLHNLLRMRKVEEFYANDQEDNGVQRSPQSKETMRKNILDRDSKIYDYISVQNSENGAVFYKLSLPPKLWMVNFARTYKLQFTIPAVQLVDSSIRYAYLAQNELNRWEGPVKGVESLLYLDLTGNNCDYVSETFFAHMSSLETLLIAQNRLGNGLGDETFRNLTALNTLHMHDNQLKAVSLNLFSGLTNLTNLKLSNNYLSSWNASISELVNLKSFNISNNIFHSLPMALCRDLDVIQSFGTVHIDIFGNPLKCDCNTQYFIEWVTTTHVSIVNLNLTFCSLENGTSVSLSKSRFVLEHLKLQCRSYTGLIGGTCACLALFSIILLAGVLHRHQWKLKYLLYMASNWRKRTGYQSLHDAEITPYGFDAFLSYEDSDRTFIREQVIPRLEIEAGLKLCIDKRDFIPGLYVTDNILHAIQNSKKTVVFLSRKFLKSKWCIYEMNMARMEGIHSGRDVLVMVLTEEIPTGELSAEMIDVIHNQTYIERTSNRHGEALFWRRLVSAVKST
ncbi:toll-like receptor 4 [Liolophura sinensis]|uniref:toll-like receptor 4 n=1 Tax=Liolophura sinensis TaxID=3198878 RepID=UPI003157F4B9